MRRKDREITDLRAILRIIDACDILRLGLADGACPYIVPLNFAYVVREGRLEFYVHGAMAGRKYDLMRRRGVCAFELDLPLGIALLPGRRDVTMRYQSVMGTARIDFLGGEEKRRAMDDVIMARYAQTRGFDYDKAALARTAVARLTVMSLTAKANPAPAD